MIDNSEDSESHVDLFNPPPDAERMFEHIKLARMFKEEAAERTQKRYDAIAAMPPLKIKNDHVLNCRMMDNLNESSPGTNDNLISRG